MYEEDIKEILVRFGEPMGVHEVRRELARRLGKSLEEVSYETVKKDLKDLAAIGQIFAKNLGRGKRSSWLFWASSIIKGKSKPAEKPPRFAPAADPFEISIEKRDSLEVSQVVALYDLLFERHGQMIREKLKTTGSCFLVLCDGKVVLSSSSSEGPSNEEVRDLERKYGKVCYVVTQDLVKEDGWSFIGDGDYYPTIELFLGAENWTDGKSL